MAVTLLAGCGEKAKPSEPKSSLTYEQMSTGDVIVVVNGTALTKGMVECEIAVQQELVKIARPQAKISDLERVRTKCLRGAERRFVERCAMREEARRRGIELTVADRQEVRDRFVKSVMRKGRAMYGLLAAKLDAASRAELDEGLNGDKLCQKVHAVLREECRAKVSEAEGQKRFRELEAYNVRAKAEEALVWKNASNVWQRIQCGEKFEQAAARCTAENEHANSDMDWGEFELDFFKDDAEFCHFLTVMPVGTVSPPVPGDNGVLIVKMLEKIPVDFGSGRLSPRYRLAKIFFQLPELYELTTPEELCKEMERVRTNKALAARIADIVGGAKVEYPNGKIQLSPGGLMPAVGLGPKNVNGQQKGTK